MQRPHAQCSVHSCDSKDNESPSAGTSSAGTRAAAPSTATFDATHFNLSAALHALHEEDVPADGANAFECWSLDAWSDDMLHLAQHAYVRHTNSSLLFSTRKPLNSK